jgi:hypothetical protein
MSFLKFWGEKESMFDKWTRQSETTEKRLEEELAEANKKRAEKVPELVEPFINQVVTEVTAHTRRSGEKKVELNIVELLTAPKIQTNPPTTLQNLFSSAITGTEQDTPTKEETLVFANACVAALNQAGVKVDIINTNDFDTSVIIDWTEKVEVPKEENENE